MRCASKGWIAAVVAAFAVSSGASSAAAQVLSEQKISATEGGFTGTLPSGSQFGRAVASIGDFDGDGVGDIAVGSFLGSQGDGSIWLLYLNADGTVKENHEITGFGSFHVGGLRPSAGAALDSLGDHDGDGVCDLIVGAPGDDTAGTDAGAAWIVLLNREGCSGPATSGASRRPFPELQ